MGIVVLSGPIKRLTAPLDAMVDRNERLPPSQTISGWKPLVRKLKRCSPSSGILADRCWFAANPFYTVSPALSPSNLQGADTGKQTANPSASGAFVWLTLWPTCHASLASWQNCSRSLFAPGQLGVCFFIWQVFWDAFQSGYLKTWCQGLVCLLGLKFSRISCFKENLKKTTRKPLKIGQK